MKWVLFGHVLFAMVWMGGSVYVEALAAAVKRRSDPIALGATFRDIAGLNQRSRSDHATDSDLGTHPVATPIDKHSRAEAQKFVDFMVLQPVEDRVVDSRQRHGDSDGRLIGPAG